VRRRLGFLVIGFIVALAPIAKPGLAHEAAPHCSGAGGRQWPCGPAGLPAPRQYAQVRGQPLEVEDRRLLEMLRLQDERRQEALRRQDEPKRPPAPLQEEPGRQTAATQQDEQKRREAQAAAAEEARASETQRICRQYPALCAPKDSQTVEFLFATTRKTTSEDPVRFGGERGDLVFGAARVHIPGEHHVGRIELPGYTVWNLVGYDSQADETKHFVIRSTVRLSQDDWKDYIGRLGADEALVFVHGYRTSFEHALYRNAQIIADLQYTRGISVLFSWASNDGLFDYMYDMNSALDAREGFLQVIRALSSAGIKKIHVLAHSMGNLLVLDALATEARKANPPRIAQLIMASPDVDEDVFRQLAPEVRPITEGMTLYVSSADKALDVSRALAKVPRAGDVTAAGPVVLPGIDTIDVTAAGSELFGLNHSTFANGRSVLNDIDRILRDGLRPPDARLPVEIQPVFEGSPQPKFWRYRD
jgi:esterase/lipase superfamily enzyme